MAKVNDELYIISKKHIDRKVVVSQNDFNHNLIIELEKKPEELKEVIILKPATVKFKVSQYEINQRDQLKLQNDAKKPVVQGVYTGEIVNGIDFMRLGEDIIRLFKKKDEDKLPPKPIIIFKDYIATHFKDSFFINTLKLEQDQIYAFIDYCNDDPNAKIVVQNNNELEVMDFLITKSTVFKKLK